MTKTVANIIIFAILAFLILFLVFMGPMIIDFLRYVVFYPLFN